jgi:hypothetical protein
MSSFHRSPRRYEQPRWPQDQPFILEALGHGGGYVLGPFTADQWLPYPGEPGEIEGATQIAEKPIRLRVRGQEQINDGPLILHANDGSISDMDYAVWTRATWRAAHPGEDWPS